LRRRKEIAPVPESVLVPAADLAQKNTAHFPNESPEYRAARQHLLIAELELRRKTEEVAALRRALPAGGEVPQNYVFDGPDGPVTLEQLFGDKDTLILYSYMFGPEREAPCPMCTSTLATWQPKVQDLQQRVAFAVIARSPYERLAEWKRQRGWGNVPLYSDASGDYTRAYVSADDGDVPAVNVFTRRDGTIRHFWSAEMNFDMADPGQDPRGHADIDPLWTWLDLTPGGRGGDWYPSLTYAQAASSCCH
jgi:predicted dithiol-disulfide oxidoreductase (DUF899 family)